MASIWIPFESVDYAAGGPGPIMRCRFAALALSAALGCRDAAEHDDEPDVESSPWFGTTPSECAEPEVDAEVLACGGRAIRLVLSPDRVFWTAGTNELVCHCPEPALYSVARTGGARETLLEPEMDLGALAVGQRLYISSSEEQVRHATLAGEDLGVLTNQRALDLAVAGGEVYWIGATDRALWSAPETALDDVAPVDETRTTALAARDEWLAWITEAAQVNLENRADGRLDTLSLADGPSPMQIGIFDGEQGIVLVSDDEGLRRIDVRGGQRERLVTGGVESFASEGRIVAFIANDLASVRALDVDTGETWSLVEYPDIGFAKGILVADGRAYWHDGRVVTAPLLRTGK